jgi:hypothetical protein
LPPILTSRRGQATMRLVLGMLGVGVPLFVCRKVPAQERELEICQEVCPSSALLRAR